MKAKRILLIITTIVCLMLWACGSDEKDNTSSNNTTSGEEKTENGSNSETQNKEDNTEKTTDKELTYFSVVGLKADEAEEKLKKEGFKVEVRNDESDDVENDHVISQHPSPADNSTLSADSIVTITVCIGKKESQNYGLDISKLDMIANAIRMLKGDNNADISFVDGKIDTLARLMVISSNKNILSNVLKDVFDENGCYKAESLVFKGITTLDVRVKVTDGDVSVLVPVNKEYAKDFKYYSHGNVIWPGEMTVKNDISAEPVKLNLKVWTMYEDYNSGWIQERCEAFNSLHPEWDITFEFEVRNIAEAAIDLEKDKNVDVYPYPNDGLALLIEMGCIAPFKTTYADNIKNSNEENVLASVTKGDDIYGVPFTGNTWFMYYDKSVYSEQDILSLDAMMDKKPIAFPITNGWHVYSFYEGNGCSLYGGNNDESAGVDMSGEKAVEVTRYLMDKINTGKILPVDHSTVNGIEELRQGRVGAIFSGCWDMETIKSILGENMGIAILPTYNLNGKEIPMYSFYGTKVYGINPQREAYNTCPEAVEAFVEFLGNADSQKTHYEMANVVPALKELVESDYCKDDVLSVVQYNTIKDASIIQPSNASMSNYFWGNIDAFMKDVISGAINESNLEKEIEKLNERLNGR